MRGKGESRFPLFGLEQLENRQLLSGALPVSEVEAPFDPDGAALLQSVAKASARVTIPRVVGNYVGNASFTDLDVSGEVVLRITSQRSGTISGKIYSSEFGGFNVTLKGTTTANRRISLSGKNSDTNVKSVRGTITADGQSLSANLVIDQMGIDARGTFQAGKVASAPAPAMPHPERIAGTWRGSVLVDGGDDYNATLRISKQTGGHLWGRVTVPGVDFDENVKGVILEDGRFQLMAPGERFEMWGGRTSGGIAGNWEYFTEGEWVEGTFNFRK